GRLKAYSSSERASPEWPAPTARRFSAARRAGKRPGSSSCSKAACHEGDTLDAKGSTKCVGALKRKGKEGTAMAGLSNLCWRYPPRIAFQLKFDESSLRMAARVALHPRGSRRPTQWLHLLHFGRVRAGHHAGGGRPDHRAVGDERLPEGSARPHARGHRHP